MTLTTTQLDAYGRDNILVCDRWTQDDQESPARVYALFPANRMEDGLRDLQDDHCGIDLLEKFRFYRFFDGGWRHATVVLPE